MSCLLFLPDWFTFSREIIVILILEATSHRKVLNVVRAVHWRSHFSLGISEVSSARFWPRGSRIAVFWRKPAKIFKIILVILIIARRFLLGSLCCCWLSRSLRSCYGIYRVWDWWKSWSCCCGVISRTSRSCSFRKWICRSALKQGFLWLWVFLFWLGRLWCWRFGSR